MSISDTNLAESAAELTRLWYKGGEARLQAGISANCSGKTNMRSSRDDAMPVLIDWQNEKTPLSLEMSTDDVSLRATLSVRKADNGKLELWNESCDLGLRISLSNASIRLLRSVDAAGGPVVLVKVKGADLELSKVS